ncbi:MFS transporter [Lichenicoccus roseus]|uniref:MFS transporter n=1 Tax=Lichenicoccus roseus TaxID=2683649 RepID=UPI001981574F|nr:MFS transporter [Lichenicoccus roseus]
MKPDPAVVEALEAAYRKVAWRLIPFLVLCFFCAYIDRINVGFAKLQMLRDLGFSDAVFGAGAGIFFLSYALLEIPSNLILARVGARRWIARIMVSWGCISALGMFVRTPAEFYALRLLLGIAEAGFAPGILLYVSQWFPARHRGSAMSAFFMAIPLSGMIGAPLSGWLLGALQGIAGLSGWQWLFLVEAAPAVLVGFGCLVVLRDTPRDAPWLDAGERRLLEQDRAADAALAVDHAGLAAFLRDRRIWTLSALYFCIVMGQYAISFWLPTIVREAGIHSLGLNGVLTAVPFLAALVAMPLLGRSADRGRRRRLHLAGAMVVGGAGLVLAPLAGQAIVPALACLCAAAAGLLSATALFWPLPPALLGGLSAAAGIALINALGNIAGFASPFLVGLLTRATGTTEAGMFAIAGIVWLGACLVFATPARLVDR